KLVSLYVEQRQDGEQFVETFNRVGIAPFKERVYAAS
ncbi:MAG: sulfite reductase (NADPH) hemoprotein beta-component, partial [Dinoroseobacter sp.]